MPRAPHRGQRLQKSLSEIEPSFADVNNSCGSITKGAEWKPLCICSVRGAAVLGLASAALAVGNHGSAIIWSIWLAIVLTATEGACWLQNQLWKSAAQQGATVPVPQSRSHFAIEDPTVGEFVADKPIEFGYSVRNTGIGPGTLIRSASTFFLLIEWTTNLSLSKWRNSRHFPRTNTLLIRSSRSTTKRRSRVLPPSRYPKTI